MVFHAAGVMSRRAFSDGGQWVSALGTQPGGPGLRPVRESFLCLELIHIHTPTPPCPNYPPLKRPSARSAITDVAQSPDRRGAPMRVPARPSTVLLYNAHPTRSVTQAPENGPCLHALLPRMRRRQVLWAHSAFSRSPPPALSVGRRRLEATDSPASIPPQSRRLAASTAALARPSRTDGLLPIRPEAEPQFEASPSNPVYEDSRRPTINQSAYRANPRDPGPVCKDEQSGSPYVLGSGRRRSGPTSSGYRG